MLVHQATHTMVAVAIRATVITVRRAMHMWEDRATLQVPTIRTIIASMLIHTTRTVIHTITTVIRTIRIVIHTITQAVAIIQGTATTTTTITMATVTATMEAATTETATVGTTATGRTT